MTSRFGAWRTSVVLAATGLCAALAIGAATRSIAQATPAPPVAWDRDAQIAFYHLDQGSQLIPLAWLQALRTRDNRPFLEDHLARYGFLVDTVHSAQLPIGFSTADTPSGSTVGMTCSACHTRQITANGETRLIDGGPAFIDFQSFVSDLDRAVIDVIGDEQRFTTFAVAVLGKGADDGRRAGLRDALQLWSTRMHALVTASMDPAQPWGPARLDAMQLIFNQLAGLDIGSSPDGLLRQNMIKGSAPVRYPFLWNAAVQDHVQWGGFSKNGSDILALTRNLGQLYGVFGSFRPRSPGSDPAGQRDYLSQNSANLPELMHAEELIKRVKPPVWPWPVDATLAAKGAEIFARSPEQGGCVACHGERTGTPRTPDTTTWFTPRLDVGTDTSVWDNVLLRNVTTGRMEGASVPGYFPALKKTDSALSLLEVSVLGSIFQYQAAHRPDMMRDMPKEGPTEMPRREMVETPPPDMRDAFKAYVYEARVLHGIWAAAPYLHNGSVPTLADLLAPASARPTRFRIGPAYDLDKIGLAVDQRPETFTLTTTGCEARGSGVSRCGHEFGTQLPPADKKALLEYLKTL